MQSLSLYDYKPFLEAVKNDLQSNRDATRDARCLMKRKLDAFLEISADRSEIPGDRIMQHLHATLDQCGLVRTHTQRKFHRNFIRACLPHIYGPADFERYKERILLENVCADNYKQYVLIVTPRRWGKTTSVALFVAAMLWCVPDMWISVYSTGRRASNALAEQVAKFVCHLDDGQGAQRIAKRNQEELFLKGDNAEDIRRLFSYPSKWRAAP